MNGAGRWRLALDPATALRSMRSCRGMGASTWRQALWALSAAEAEQDAREGTMTTKHTPLPWVACRLIDGSVLVLRNKHQVLSWRVFAVDSMRPHDEENNVGILSKLAAVFQVGKYRHEFWPLLDFAVQLAKSHDENVVLQNQLL